MLFSLLSYLLLVLQHTVLCFVQDSTVLHHLFLPVPLLVAQHPVSGSKERLNGALGDATEYLDDVSGLLVGAADCYCCCIHALVHCWSTTSMPQHSASAQEVLLGPSQSQMHFLVIGAGIQRVVMISLSWSLQHMQLHP